MSDDLYNLIGMLGPALFLWSYAMLSLGYWSGAQVRTHVPNLLGAIAIGVSLIRFWNLPVAILECCWGAISIYGIVRCLRRPPAATSG
ncbi:MAG: hypothetical protein WDN72_01980 [Alphaproteobacteria bacterium]